MHNELTRKWLISVKKKIANSSIIFVWCNAWFDFNMLSMLTRNKKTQFLPLFLNDAMFCLVTTNKIVDSKHLWPWDESAILLLFICSVHKSCIMLPFLGKKIPIIASSFCLELPLLDKRKPALPLDRIYRTRLSCTKKINIWVQSTT